MWTHWEEGQKSRRPPKSSLWGFKVRSEFKSRAKGMLSKQRCPGAGLQELWSTRGWSPGTLVQALLVYKHV